MNSRTALFFAFYMAGHCAFAQSIADKIKEIENKVQAIKQHTASYAKKVIVQDSTNYNYRYLEGNKLRFITIQYRDKGLKKDVAWYYSDNKMIFATQKWRDTIPYHLVDGKDFYFSNDELIAWIDNGKQKDPASEEFRSLNAQFHKLIDYQKKTVLGDTLSATAQPQSIKVRSKVQKSIMVIGSGKKGTSSFRISGDSVWLPPIKGKMGLRIESKASDPIYDEISKIPTSDWKQMERDMKKIKNCPYWGGYVITIYYEDDTTKSFSFLTYRNCYPSSAREIMEALDKYFEKLN